MARSLSAAELVAFKKNFAFVSQADTGLAEILGIYGGYTFKPSTLPLSHDELLRAAVALMVKTISWTVT